VKLSNDFRLGQGLRCLASGSKAFLQFQAEDFRQRGPTAFLSNRVEFWNRFDSARFELPTVRDSWNNRHDALVFFSVRRRFSNLGPRVRLLEGNARRAFEQDFDSVGTRARRRDSVSVSRNLDSRNWTLVFRTTVLRARKRLAGNRFHVPRFNRLCRNRHYHRIVIERSGRLPVDSQLHHLPLIFSLERVVPARQTASMVCRHRFNQSLKLGSNSIAQLASAKLLRQPPPRPRDAPRLRRARHSSRRLFFQQNLDLTRV